MAEKQTTPESSRKEANNRAIRIVLVEPRHPGNIGGAARAMKTMGLNQLWVVNPKRYPDPQADWRAAGALDVLDAAQVVESVDQAIADCHWVVGTSTRLRRIPWPVATAREIARQVQDLPAAAKVAVLFGREDNGLSNEELRLCNFHLQIPADESYPSLNLAMAVQVVCYELFQSTGPEIDQSWDRRWATNGEVEGLAEHLQSVLTESEFLDNDNPGQTMTRLMRLFKRAHLDETEVQILRGLAKHIQRLMSGAAKK